MPSSLRNVHFSPARRRNSNWLKLAIVCALTLIPGASWSDDRSPLQIYAVTVNRTPKQTWQGNGIYLGRGLVLTAAHVVGWTFWTKPKVVVAGRELTTETVREGSLKGTDLTLLSVDQNQLPVWLALRLNPICRSDGIPGQPVATIDPVKVAYAKVLSANALPRNTRRFRTLIDEVAATTNSGSGVFDIDHKCLLGIISRKISRPVKGSKQMRDVAKYFVPASEIRAFIPEQYRY